MRTTYAFSSGEHMLYCSIYFRMRSYPPSQHECSSPPPRIECCSFATLFSTAQKVANNVDVQVECITGCTLSVLSVPAHAMNSFAPNAYRHLSIELQMCAAFTTSTACYDSIHSAQAYFFLPFVPRVFATFPLVLPAGAFSFLLLAPGFTAGLAGAGAACSSAGIKDRMATAPDTLSAHETEIAP